MEPITKRLTGPLLWRSCICTNQALCMGNIGRKNIPTRAAWKRNHCSSKEWAISNVMSEAITFEKAQCMRMADWVAVEKRMYREVMTDRPRATHTCLVPRSKTMRKGLMAKVATSTRLKHPTPEALLTLWQCLTKAKTMVKIISIFLPELL